MGFDLVTWSPAIGGGGDNNYNVPGATKLDGTVDAGSPCVVKAGSSAGFSATPTIQQINLTTDFAQVYGLYNRRAKNYNAEFGTALAVLAYPAAGPLIKASDIFNLQTKINTLRTTEGFANYPFVIPVPTAGAKLLGRHLAELRKALGIFGVLTLNAKTSGFQYTRTDATWNSTAGASEVIAAGSFRFGKTVTNKHERTMDAFAIPDWATSVTSATVTGAGNPVLALDGGFTPLLFSYNYNVGTPVVAPACNGTFYNPTNLEVTFSFVPSGSGVWFETKQFGTVPITARAGGYLYLMLASSEEYNQTGAAPNPGNSDSLEAITLALTF